MTMIRNISLLTALCVVSFSAPSYAQSYAEQALAAKIERLERDMIMLQREFFKGGGASASAGNPSLNITRLQDGAALGVRLTSLEEQLRGLNGRLEEIEHRQQALSQQYNSMIEQISYLQRSGTAAPTPTAASAPSQPFTNLTPSSNAVSVDPIRSQYDTAFELLKQARYPEAEAALKEFLDKNENHPLASGAFYWLGESYYMQKNYEQAAIQFLRGYKKFPKGEKAPDSLLKLAITLGSLNKVKEACTSLDKLTSEFKDAANAIKQRAQEESKRLSCS